MTKKEQKFIVGFVIKQWRVVEVVATSLEEALTAGRKLTIDQVLAGENGYNDSSIKVVQAYDSDFEI